MAERVVAWVSSKREPRMKETKTGKPVYEVSGSIQTEAYEAWVNNGRVGDAPDRYLYVDFSVFEPQIEHAQKIVARVTSSDSSDDPRPHVLFTGRWAGSREYQGKTYANFWVSELSPLLWGPLTKGR